MSNPSRPDAAPETERTATPDPSEGPRDALLASSTLAFVLAAMVSDTLHEGAHALAGAVQGLVPTLTPFAVDFAPEGTVRQQVVHTAAGPVFSLLFGLLLMRVSRSWGRGVLRLFFLWLAFISVMNFVGYLFIAPFASVGATGQVLHLLGAPVAVYVVVALIGVAGQFWLAREFARQVSRYADTVQAQRRLAYLAWILGTVVVVVVTVTEVLALGADPATVVVVVFYSCAVGIFGPMQFLFSRRFPARHEALAVSRVSRLALVLAVLLAAALIALSFAGGVRLG